MQTIPDDLLEILRSKFQAGKRAHKGRIKMIFEAPQTIACDASLISDSTGMLTDTGEDPDLSLPFTFEPDDPPTTPAMIIGAYWSRNHTGAYGSGPIADSISGDFTQIDSTRTDYPFSFSSFGVAAYQAVPQNGETGEMTIDGTGFTGDAFHTRAISVAIPTSATAPINFGAQSGSGGTAVMDQAPVAGNALVQIRFVEGAGIGGGGGISGDWTVLAEGEIYNGTGSEMLAQIAMRCVDEGEDENVTVGDSAFSHWSFVIELENVQLVESEQTVVGPEHGPMRIDIDKSLRMVCDGAIVSLVNEGLPLGWGPRGEGAAFLTNRRVKIEQWYGREANAIRTFTGVIDSIHDSRDPLAVGLNLRDMMAILADQGFSAIAPQKAGEAGAIRTEANGVFLNLEVSAIVDKLLDLAGWPTADRAITPTSYVLDEFVLGDGQSYASAIIGKEKLTGLVGYSAWADEFGVFHFAPTLVSSSFTEPTEPDYIYRPGVDLVALDDETDQYDLRTRVKVRGPLTTTTLTDTWREVWRTRKFSKPVGLWHDPADPANLRVLDRGTKRMYKLRQSDRAILSSVNIQPIVAHPLGLSGDPADPGVYWLLNAPWIDGVAGTNRVKKVRKSDNKVLASFDLPAGNWSAIKVSASFLWLTNLSTDRFYKRSKSTGAAIDDYRHTVNSVLQSNPSGLMIDGTTISVFWSNGGSTARFVKCDESAPAVETGIVKTAGTVLHGGEMDTVTHIDCYGDSDSLGLVAKFTLKTAVSSTTEVFAEVINGDLEDELGELASLEPRAHDVHSGDLAHPYMIRRLTLDLSVITSLAQATETAERQLDISSQRRRVVDAGVIANPAIQKTDAIAVVDPKTGVSTLFVVDTYRTNQAANGVYLGTLALIPLEEFDDTPEDEGDASE